MVPDGSNGGPGPTFLAHLDENQGLVLKNENQGLQQHRADDESGTVLAASLQGKSETLPCY